MAARRNWQPDEVQRLSDALQELGVPSHRNWNEIAARVGTRTNEQCYQYYRTIADPIFRQRTLGPWRPDEEQRLRAAIGQLGAHNWRLISQLVGTRTDDQCNAYYHHYIEGQAPPQPPQRFVWTPEQNTRLGEVFDSGAQLTPEVAQYVGHTLRECRERIQHLRPPPKGWTQEQDELLLSMIDRGTPLPKVAPFVRHTFGECRKRLGHLRPAMQPPRWDFGQRTIDTLPVPQLHAYQPLPAFNAEFDGSQDWNQFLQGFQ
jgi:hypothetical protein